MSSAVTTPTKPRRVPQPDATLEQILDRHRELMLMREYQPGGIVDFIWVVRPGGTVQMDFRKQGPRIGFNAETGDLLVLSPWQGLPDLALPDAALCTACLGTCGDCQGKGMKPCTLPGCAGSGFRATRFEPCPKCLGSEKKQTNLKCGECRGRGEVPIKDKCPGCDKDGQAQCARCQGKGKIATGRANGASDGVDGSGIWKAAPVCKSCNGQGRIIASKPQEWKQFVHGRLTVQGREMIALGPIARILWHTMGEGARFQSCEIAPDRGGNLMVLLLEGDQPGARQFLVGGVPQIK